MIKKLYSVFKKHKFKSQLFFAFLKYFLIQIVFISVVISIVTVFLINKSDGELQTENNNRVHRIEDMSNVVFRQTNIIASGLCIDSDVTTFVHGKSALINKSREKKIVEKLVYYKKITEYIDSIYIYSPEKQRICTTNMLFYEDTQFSEFNDYSFLEWVEKNMDSNTMTVPRKINRRYPRVISLIKKIQGGGYVVINIGYEKFLDTLEMAFESNTEIFILDNSNNIVFPESVSNEDMDSIKSVLISENGRHIDKSSGQMFSCLSIDSYLQNFVIKNDVSGILKSRIIVMLIVLFAWLFFIIVSIFTAIYLSFSSLKIVIKLQDVLDNKQIDLNNMSDNEEKHIIAEILKLIDDNRAFKKKLDDTLSKFNEMQIMALQKQINPHFLNNMLTTICYKIQTYDEVDPSAINMIVMLTRIIDYGFNNDSIMIPLSKEIDFIRIYVSMLKEGCREFEFITNIEESVLNHKVLRLSIQPFIENAIYHGIYKMKRNGKITLSAKKEDGKVIIIIEDNGVGMSLDKINEINELIENGGSSEHIGIYNAYQRLRVVYSDECNLKYESDGMSGTKMILTTPIFDDGFEKNDERN